MQDALNPQLNPQPDKTQAEKYCAQPEYCDLSQMA